MPRSSTDKSSPVRVRIDRRDLERIEDLYRYRGLHGNLSRLVQTGTRLQILIEEITRGRYPASGTTLAAIHTLQAAVDRRDRGEDEEGEEQTGGTESGI